MSSSGLSNFGAFIKARMLFDLVVNDMQKLQEWKQGVCNKMSGGVAQLLKGNSVTIIMGDATFTSAKALSVKGKEGTLRNKN